MDYRQYIRNALDDVGWMTDAIDHFSHKNQNRNCSLLHMLLSPFGSIEFEFQSSPAIPAISRLEYDPEYVHEAVTNHPYHKLPSWLVTPAGNHPFVFICVAGCGNNTGFIMYGDIVECTKCGARSQYDIKVINSMSSIHVSFNPT